MNDDHLFWVPSPSVNLFGSSGVTVYTMMTWVALIGGIAIWLLQTRSLKVSNLQRLLSLMVIAGICIPTTRLFHIFFWSFSQYMDHPSLWWRLGIGHSVHGTILGFVLSAVVIARIFSVSVSETADRLAFWPIFGLIFVRIGNFWNSEIVGTMTDVSFGVRFFYTPDHGRVLRHPVQLYESGFCFLLLLVMLVVFLVNRRRTPWLLSAMALIGYSIGRFAFDFFKEEPGYFFGPWLTTGQVLSIPFFVLGVHLLLFANRQGKRSA